MENKKKLKPGPRRKPPAQSLLNIKRSHRPIMNTCVSVSVPQAAFHCAYIPARHAGVTRWSPRSAAHWGQFQPSPKAIQATLPNFF